MTAEIVVANKSAVALAADSKVTIGGMRGAKTYDTVNKVFTLSKVHPVGIMIFGNAEFMGYPWETIIKLYRKERGAEKKDTVSEWSDDFIEYVKSFGKVDDAHRQYNVRSIVSSWLNILEDKAMSQALHDGTPVPSNDYSLLLIRTIAEQTDALADAAPFLSKGAGTKFLKKYSGPIMNAVADVFSSAKPDDELFKAAIRFSVFALCTHADSPQSSGFVIAGFGEKEFFPTIIEHNTDGWIGDRLKLRSEKVQDIRRSMSGYVGAYAQKDMVQGFMHGFDPYLLSKLASGFGEALADSCVAVLDEHGLKSKKTDKMRGEIRAAAAKRSSDLIKAFMDESKDRFWGPILDMVSVLPKDELASLAESLVALTSLRRRVSHDVETVGGPIDVALISKGDGFIWIKRKYYFRAELNPQFDLNYMRDVRQEEG